jgi:hypothetical protein
VISVTFLALFWLVQSIFQNMNITSVPPQVSLVHFVPGCTASDIVQLSNTSNTILLYLREIGAFHFLYVRDLPQGLQKKKDGATTTTTVNVSPFECEQRLRRAMPCFQWLGAGIGGRHLTSADNGSAPLQPHVYRFGDVGGTPRHPEQQVLPKYLQLQRFTQVDTAGKRLIGLANATIAVWMQKGDKAEPHRMTFATLQACSGSKGSSKKKKKRNNNNTSAGNNKSGCLAVTACKTNPDLIAAVFHRSTHDDTFSIERSLQIFDLCEDLNVPVATTQFTVKRQHSNSEHTAFVNFIGKESKRNICVRDRWQFHIFSAPEGQLLSTVGNGELITMTSEPENRFAQHWHQFNANWSRHSMCHVDQDRDELVVACTAGGCPIPTDDKKENALLHVWNAQSGSDYYVGDASLTAKLHVLLENPATLELPEERETNSGTEQEDISEEQEINNNNNNDNNINDDAGHVLWTCAENRCFMVHSRHIKGHRERIQGVNMTCRTVVSHWKLSSSKGTFVGHSETVVERKSLPCDMSVVVAGRNHPNTRILIVCDKYEATLHSCGPNVMLTRRVAWRQPLLTGSTVLFSGMSSLPSEFSAGETKNNHEYNSDGTEASPFVLIEVRRHGLVGYGPGIEPPWNAGKKQKNKKSGSSKKKNGMHTGGGQGNKKTDSYDSEDDEEERGGKKKKKKKRQASSKAKGVKVRMRCGGGR